MSKGKLLDVTMNVREEVVVEEEYKKPLYDWRYENSINFTKQHFDVESKLLDFKYAAWNINKYFSNFQDTIAHADNMNKAAHIDLQLHFDYMFHAVRKKKRFFKGQKASKDAEFESVKQYYKYNNKRTEEVMNILSQDQIDIIAKRQEKGGRK